MRERVDNDTDLDHPTSLPKGPVINHSLGAIIARSLTRSFLGPPCPTKGDLNESTLVSEMLTMPKDMPTMKLQMTTRR
jgi:hypothetical protein